MVAWRFKLCAFKRVCCMQAASCRQKLCRVNWPLQFTLTAYEKSNPFYSFYLFSLFCFIDFSLLYIFDFSYVTRPKSEPLANIHASICSGRIQ